MGSNKKVRRGKGVKSQYVKKSNDGVSKGHSKKPAGDMFSPVIQETLSDP